MTEPTGMGGAAPDERRGRRTTAEQLRRSLRWLVAATVFLYLAFFAAGVKVYLDGKQTTNALCTYRADLTSRVIQSTEYLNEHPNGNPALGISAKDILTQIANQQRAILAFKDLNCDTGVSAALKDPTPR